MANPTITPGDIVAGATGAGVYGFSVIDLPAGSVVNADVAANAAIAASKCQRSVSVNHAQSGTAVTSTVCLRIVIGATGTLKKFRAMNITACAGASTVTVDLQKNGASILTGVATLDSGTGDFDSNGSGVEAPTIASAGVVVGDVLRAVITTVASGTDALATGVAVQLDMDEDYAS